MNGPFFCWLVVHRERSINLREAFDEPSLAHSGIVNCEGDTLGSGSIVGNLVTGAILSLGDISISWRPFHRGKFRQGTDKIREVCRGHCTLMPTILFDKTAQFCKAQDLNVNEPKQQQPPTMESSPGALMVHRVGDGWLELAPWSLLTNNNNIFLS